MSTLEQNQRPRGSNELEPVGTVSPKLLEFALDMHIAARASAGLEQRWNESSESLRQFWLRVAANTELRRREFFRC